MESSLPQQTRQASKRRWLMAAFLIYGTMIIGLLGFIAVLPAAITREAAVETTGTVAAKKPGRYEGVIANWNRYRGKGATAEAR